MITMLLNSSSQINLHQRDFDGRMPIDLCYSISSVFKTIRKQQSTIRIRTINKLSGVSTLPLHWNNTRPSLIKHTNIHLVALQNHEKKEKDMLHLRENSFSQMQLQQQFHNLSSLKYGRPVYSQNTTRFQSPIKNENDFIDEISKKKLPKRDRSM